MSSSTAPSPRDGGNLSQWVSQIQERHRGSGDVNTPEPSEPTSSAAELEEEIRRSRAERAKRRSQMSGSAGTAASGVPVSSPLQSSKNDSNITSTTSGEEALRRLLGEKGRSSPRVEREEPMAMQAAATPTSPLSYSPPKQSNALLDRYGGPSGPTGVARAGTSDSPASLASFMGGKASGPRLGKLVGDGRSAPPELSMVDDTPRRALPGMTSGATPLANFLEARAGGHNTAPAAAAVAHTPSRTTTLPAGDKPTLGAQIGAPTRSHSEEQASRTLAVTTQTDNTMSRRSDMATSPLKADQVGASKALSPSKKELEKPKRTTGASASLAPSSIVHSPTSDALDRSSIAQPASAPATNTSMSSSPAFQSTQQSSDRMPTASLTRLRSKKMVEQRVKEAQERASAESSPVSSPAMQSTPAWMPSVSDASRGGGASDGGAGGVRARWPNVEPSSSPSERRGGYSSTKFGNALPGMGQSSLPNRNLYSSNNREKEERSNASAAPVPLPGMASTQSPFASRQSTAEASTQPLEQLAKGRAKPKRSARSSGGGGGAVSSRPAAAAPSTSDQATEERMGKESALASRGAFARPASPSKEPPSLSLAVDVAPSRARQDSMPIPGSAERIADSTAALEALLEGKTVGTPPHEIDRPAMATERMATRRGTLKIAKNRDKRITIDSSALLRPSVRSSGADVGKSLSVEVTSVGANGSLEPLHGEEGKVLYETETQVITHRFKEPTAAGQVVTKVYARSGRLSRLLTDAACAEAKKVQEIARQHRTEVVDARQGRESTELVKLLGGYVVTREGSRNRYERGTTCLYEVRGVEGAHFIDQVDMLTSSLCSAHSAVVALMGDVFVWHGIGSTSSNRQSAVQFADRLRSTPRSDLPLTQYEEGEEDELFWTCFDRRASYSSAWHHRFRPMLAQSELVDRLFTIQGSGDAKRLTELGEYSLLDVRRDGVAVLQLAMELYVLVGPDGRSKRKEIQGCLEAASTLARDLSRRRGSHFMTPPVHVVVFPSVAPRELKSAFRYWHDEHLNGKGWQRAGLGMNVWERRAALDQLECDEFQLWQLNDELFLPVGVGLEDVQGIDV